MIRRAAVWVPVAAVMLSLAACGSGGTASPTQRPAATPTDGSATAAAVSLSASAYSVSQSDGSLSVQVQRSGPAATAATIDYSTTDGTAVAGSDYTAASGTLSWAENDSTPKTLSIPISNSTPFSGERTFQVALGNPSPAIGLGSPGTTTVSISGGATAAAGILQLSSPSYSVVQSAGTVTVTVTRTGGSSGPVSVSYATTNGSAIAGTDFTAVSGTLQWADGEAIAKTFSVALSNATPFSGAKTFTVALSNPSPMAAIGNQSNALVTIAGDNAAAVGSFQLSTSSYAVAQSAAALPVSVNRTGGSSGAASVAYSTAN